MKRILLEKFGEDEEKFLQREKKGRFTRDHRDKILDEAIKVS